MTSNDARRYFSTDTSIFRIIPSIIVYPRNENDVRKTTRFTWQLAERGRIIPVTARGAGTDQTGGSIGEGILIVFPAHMNKVLELDSKSGVVSVEAGANYGKLQQALLTHNRFLPPYPSSLEYSTIGGAVAKNASGEKSVKYGCTRDFVRSLRVVLANGEVIETKRISKRELNKKLGLNTFEGEIYRKLDALLEEKRDLINEQNWSITKNAAGYALTDVRRKDGSFDLTPLIVGSEGTLGIVTEITLDTEPNTPNKTLIAAQFDDYKVAQDVILELRKFSEMPSAIEMVDGNLLDFVQQQNPNQLKGILEAPFPKVLLFIEFDNVNERIQKKFTKKAMKVLNKYQVVYHEEHDVVKRDELWKVRHSSALVTAYSESKTRALPIIEDGIVPVDRISEFLSASQELFERYRATISVWGHIGDGNLHMMPILDVGQLGDRQKIFKFMDEFYEMVINFGGSTSAQHGDGRLRAPYLEKLYGADMYELFKNVKQAFDPFNTLNPGVKVDVSLEDLKSHLRDDYSVEHLYDHMPHS
ncbi:MAG: hypothetical protein NVSMB46_08240 [Candidatus Saccharimonadales bacterium]